MKMTQLSESQKDKLECLGEVLSHEKCLEIVKEFNLQQTGKGEYWCDESKSETLIDYLNTCVTTTGWMKV